MRTAAAFVPLAAAIVSPLGGCGAKARGLSAPGGGSGVAGTGAAGTGAGGAGATPDPTGVSSMGTVPSGVGGDDDEGRLFTDAALVTTAGDDASSAAPVDAAAAADGGGKTAPGDGNVGTCHVGGSAFLLVFTQRGTDVTMVATATSCATGMHAIQIHDGFSCDNAGAEGGAWGGARGAGIPPLVCANNKGTLTYTRAGSDPTTSWTVGDHATKTDVTLHPVSVDSSCGTFF